jgi:RHS repeat-associated protein
LITGGEGRVAGPDGGTVVEYFYPHDAADGYYMGGASGKAGLVYKTERSGASVAAKVITERQWELKKFDIGDDHAPGGGLVVFNPVMTSEFTTLVEGTQKVKMSARKLLHDYNGNVLEEKVYDWFDPASAIYDSNGLPIDVPAAVAPNPLLVSSSVYYNGAPFSTSTNVYAKRDATTVTPLILNALQQTTVGASQTQFCYENTLSCPTPTVGNLVKISRWLDQTSQWITNTYGYDAYGNRTSSTDPNGSTINLTINSATKAEPVQITVNPGNGSGNHTTQMTYDTATGALLTQTDPNGRTNEIIYQNHRLGAVDPFGRHGTTLSPANSAGQKQETKTYYHDDARMVAVTADQGVQGDAKLRSRTTSDQLGRVTATESSEDGGSNYQISSETVYVQMGRIIHTSNPRRLGGAEDASEGWVRTSKDDLGRVVEIATFSGRTKPGDTGNSGPTFTGKVLTSYYSNETTVTDQANKARKSFADGLGRLTQIVEDPSGLGHQTTYLYDPLSNLRRVEQGSQTRFFAYDSLSRLIRARNPEQSVNGVLDLTDSFTGNNSWSIGYAYDGNGNLTARTDARNVVTSYLYDGLNRNTQLTYNDGITPQINRHYDNASLVNGKGRLWKSESIVGGVATLRSQINEYDALGRIKSYTQGFFESSLWQDYTSLTSYDLAGNRLTETYPSGRQVVTTYNPSGRLNTVASNDTMLLSGPIYAPFGGLKEETYGSGLVHTLQYNSRPQIAEISLGTWSVSDSILKFSYLYGTVNAIADADEQIAASQNNGNVGRMKYTVGGVLKYVQTFQYDVLDRLQFAVEHDDGVLTDAKRAWWQTFEYDRWGNRGLNTAGSNTSANMSQSGSALGIGDFSSSTNRITKMGFGYDGAGNLTFAPGRPNDIFDGENKLISSTDGVVQSTYSYDPDGRRVKKSVGSVVTKFVYNSTGQLIAEYGGTPPAFGLQFATADHLGSPRVWTSHVGVATNGRHDYAAFGEELGPAHGSVRSGIGGYPTISQADGQRKQFTSKERDIETGLDYFLARYYSSTQGRFTSVDPANAGAEPSNPQSWNGYAYAFNNPLKYQDPDGLKVRVCDTSGNCTDDKTDLTDEQWNKWFGGDKSIKLDNGKVYKDGELIGTYQQQSCDSCLYDIFALGRQVTASDPGGKAVKLWAGSVVAGVTGGTAYYFAAPFLAPTVTTLALRSAPLLPVVPSAIDKLQKLGLSPERANAIVQSPASQKLIDNANNGNINHIQEVGGKLIRITTDPSGQRIISAGIVRANSITNGIANGRFTPKK